MLTPDFVNFTPVWDNWTECREAASLFWRVVEILLGLFAIGSGLFSREFEPMGLTTRLIWGRGKNARIPRWIAGTFYVVLGLLILYIGVTGR